MRTRHRKGDMFMLGLDVMFLVAIILIFWKLSAAFTMQNAQEGIGTRQAAVLQTYSVSEEMLLYLDEAAKFSAYEALATLPESGATLVTDTSCKQYATYLLWTTPQRSCFPVVQRPQEKNTATTVYDAYKEQVKANLRKFLNLPGLPNAMAYDITLAFDSSGAMRVVGTTPDAITLPIVTSKNTVQSALRNVILQNNIARVTQGAFRPDTALPGVSVLPSRNRKDRAGTIRYIVITSTNTPDISTARQQYEQGLGSTHYIVDRSGGITQVVQEDQRAFFMQPCQDADGKNVCVKDVEDEAIGIALVNAGSLPVPDGQSAGSFDKNKPCSAQDPRYYESNSMRAICERLQSSFTENGVTVDCSIYDQKLCWQLYTKEQLDSLKLLVTDIARKDRRNIPVENILLEEELRLLSARPGPSLHSVPDERGKSEDAWSWYSDFKFDVTINLIKANNPVPAEMVPAAKPAADATQSDAAGDASTSASLPNIAITLPAQGALTSCYGKRTVGDGFHDGLDIAGGGDDSVRAMADGIVDKICDKWVDSNGKQCACSTVKDQGCAQRCVDLCSKDYGNFILLRHPPSSLYTRYSHLAEVNVREGQQVKRGDVIGIMGNTGASDGKHLDFKLYDSPAKAYSQNGGSNPLCYFPEDILTKLRATGSNCAQYKNGISRSSDALVKECEGTPILSSVSDCILNAQPSVAGGDAALTSTVNNLVKLGLMDELKNAASQYPGMDYRLLIAQMSQESGGSADIISIGDKTYGAAGISQFMPATAGDYFPNKEQIKYCRCDKKAPPCHLPDSNCVATDPRFDPVLSIKAQAKYMNVLVKKYGDNPDRWQLALAEYNGGGVQIRRETKAVGKTASTVRWDEISAKLSSETRGYVPKIMARYYAQGGSVASAYSDQNCGDLNVKEIGTYTFNPSFSVDVPDTLNGMQRIVDVAKKTFEECDGSGDKPVKACLDEHMASIGNGLAVVPCESDAQTAVTEFLQTISDCTANKQEDCACAWKPSLALPHNLSVALRGDSGSVFVDGDSVFRGGSSAVVLFRRMPTAAPEKQQVELRRITDDTKTSFSVNVRPPPNANAPEIASTPYAVRDAFFMYKEGGKMVWLGYDGGQVPMCGAYKTTYPICIQYTQSIPRLSSGKVERPVVKFALFLNDKYGPKSPASVSATHTGADIMVGFSASPSGDISYYNVSCRVSTSLSVYGITLPGKSEQAKDPLRVIPSGETSSVVLAKCDGEAIAPDKDYDVIVVPYDTSGNEGDGASAKAVKPQQTSGGAAS